jgi:photosystem II stability/assembly factor-like uncharacterized protein
MTQYRIRFADTTHGFVFDKTQVLATQDGGTHWERLQRPFQARRVDRTALT